MPKPKAKPKPKATPPKMTADEQSQRFIDTAKKLGADETGSEFKDAMDRIAKIRLARVR